MKKIAVYIHRFLIALLLLSAMPHATHADPPDPGCECPDGEVEDPFCSEECPFVYGCCVEDNTVVDVTDNLYFLVLLGLGIGIVAYYENKKIQQAEDEAGAPNIGPERANN